jgi:hypothetical protein
MAKQRNSKKLQAQDKEPLPDRFHIPPDITLSVVGNSYFLEQDKGDGDAALIEIRHGQKYPLERALSDAGKIRFAAQRRASEVGRRMVAEAESIHAKHPELASRIPLRELAVRVSAEESATLVKLLDESETLLAQLEDRG